MKTYSTGGTKLVIWYDNRQTEDGKLSMNGNLKKNQFRSSYELEKNTNPVKLLKLTVTVVYEYYFYIITEITRNIP